MKRDIEVQDFASEVSDKGKIAKVMVRKIGQLMHTSLLFTLPQTVDGHDHAFVASLYFTLPFVSLTKDKYSFIYIYSFEIYSILFSYSEDFFVN